VTKAELIVALADFPDDAVMAIETVEYFPSGKTKFLTQPLLLVYTLQPHKNQLNLCGGPEQ